MHQRGTGMRKKHYSMPVAIILWLSLGFQPGSASEEHEVVMFSIDFCPACEAAKQYFAENGIAYNEFNLDESERARDAFERLGGRGTPLLFLEGESMNGFHPQRFRAFWHEATGTELPQKQQ
jgi:glutaredoxin